MNYNDDDTYDTISSTANASYKPERKGLLNAVGRAWSSFVVNVASFCGCFGETDMAEVTRDLAIRRAIRARMVENTGATIETAIHYAAKQEFEKTGYDLTNCASLYDREYKGTIELNEVIARQNKEATEKHAIALRESDVRRRARIVEYENRTQFADTDRESDDEDMGDFLHSPRPELRLLKPRELPPPPPKDHVASTTVRVIPRFAAAMINVLRSKFGPLVHNEANVLLVKREYHRLCRDGSVRMVDTNLHYQYVVNGFFFEGIHSQSATTKMRLKSWLRKHLYPETGTHADAAC